MKIEYVTVWKRFGKLCKPGWFWWFLLDFFFSICFHFFPVFLPTKFASCLLAMLACLDILSYPVKNTYQIEVCPFLTWWNDEVMNPRDHIKVRSIMIVFLYRFWVSCQLFNKESGPEKKWVFLVQSSKLLFFWWFKCTATPGKKCITFWKVWLLNYQALLTHELLMLLLLIECNCQKYYQLGNRIEKHKKKRKKFDNLLDFWNRLIQINIFWVMCSPRELKCFHKPVTWNNMKKLHITMQIKEK